MFTEGKKICEDKALRRRMELSIVHRHVIILYPYEASKEQLEGNVLCIVVYMAPCMFAPYELCHSHWIRCFMIKAFANVSYGMLKQPSVDQFVFAQEP